MKKKEPNIKKIKPNKIGFESSVSIYKHKFSEDVITFRPKFSITKNIIFSVHKKVANNLARPFVKFKPSRF